MIWINALRVITTMKNVQARGYVTAEHKVCGAVSVLFTFPGKCRIPSSEAALPLPAFVH